MEDKKAERKEARRQRKLKKAAALKAKLDIGKGEVKLTKSGRVSKRKAKSKRLPEWYKPQFKINNKVEFTWLGSPSKGQIVDIIREEVVGFAKEGRVQYLVKTETGRIYPVGYMGSSTIANIVRKVPRKKRNKIA